MDLKKEALQTLKYLLKIIKYSSSNQKQAQSYEISYGGAKYLLGQALRQIQLPEDKQLVSVKAMRLWINLGKNINEIWDISYKMKVENNTNLTIPLKKYRGAAKTPYDDQVTPKGWFYYREVFHDDHITTIKSIIEQLENLNLNEDEAITDKKIYEILTTIKVAKILKEEDRAISRFKKGLPKNADNAEIKEYYAKKSIILKTYDEWCAYKETLITT